MSDWGDHCVKVFDNKAKFLYRFGKKGEGNEEFNQPGCLSVNNVGHLLVYDSYNQGIQVFELSGKFVTKFGTKGSEIGEFSLPFSVAFLNDG